MLWPLLAGLTAVGLGFWGNRLIWRLCGRAGTFFLVPFWEEALKTGLGLLSGRLVFVHAFFGLAEAAWEMRGRQWAAAFWAFFTHLGFGLLTFLLRRWSGSAVAAWLAVAVLHAGWNRLVARFGGTG